MFRGWFMFYYSRMVVVHVDFATQKQERTISPLKNTNTKWPN